MMTFEKTTDFVVEHNMDGCIVTPLEVLSYIYKIDIREVADLFTQVIANKAEDKVRNILQSIYDE